MSTLASLLPIGMLLADHAAGATAPGPIASSEGPDHDVQVWDAATFEAAHDDPAFESEEDTPNVPSPLDVRYPPERFARKVYEAGTFVIVILSHTPAERRRRREQIAAN